jgi:hypothetical protein
VRCQHLKFTKLSKGVSKIVPKFPHESIFRTTNYGTLLLAFLFLRNVLLEIPVDLASCRKSRRPCSINYFPASQVEAIEVEIFSSNQGSRKVNVEKSSITFSSRSVLITFESSESSREITQNRPKLFATLSLLLLRT